MVRRARAAQINVVDAGVQAPTKLRRLIESGICPMLSSWRRRNERMQQVIRDADILMAPLGERAYSEALARVRREDENGSDPSHWFAVRQEIARFVGRERPSQMVSCSCRHSSHKGCDQDTGAPAGSLAGAFLIWKG